LKLDIYHTVWTDAGDNMERHLLGSLSVFHVSTADPINTEPEKHPLNVKEGQSKLFLINSVNFSKCFQVNPWDMKI